MVAVGTNAQGQSNVGSWTNIIAISNGYNHTVGLKSDGTVVAVGDNYYGNCNVGGFNNIISISAGFYHTIGLKNNGTMVSVGRNNFGQLGDGTTTNRSTVINVNTSVTNIKRLYDIPPPPPPPTFGSFSIASKTFGDAAFAITAPSSNSPGSFSYSSSNTSVATVSGSNITIVGAGSTIITATQASTSNYNASGSVTATLVVAKANPTINLVLQNTSNVILTNYNAVSYIKNKIPKDDILNLVVNSNSPGLISYGSNNTTIASISSVGLIRRRDYGNVRFTVSQPETSNYNSKTVHLNITIVPQASYGNRPNFLLGL